MTPRALSGLALATAGLLASLTPALAEYPEKPIRLIIPYRAGGGSDSLARTIQKAVEQHKLMKVPLVVVNITGAGGAVAARRLRSSKPDGYTFMQIHNGLLSAAATGRLGFEPSAFEYVAQTTQSCVYLAVPGDSPIKNFEEFVKAAKAAPGKLKAADNIGGVTHFPWVSLMKETGTNVGLVQTGGTAKRFAAIKGGHVQLALMSPGWIKRAGDQLRGILWLGPTRHPVAPDMPTAKEKGIDVTACLNRRFWAPKGTPPERIAYFANVLKKVMETEELKAYHKKRLSDIVFRTGEELKKDIEDEYKRFLDAAPVVKASMQKKK